MEYTWRWFGPDDPVSLADIRQAGATGIVTALHHLPNDTVWPAAEIAARKALIEAAGLRWSVVESIPVPEAIKLGQAGWQDMADTWAHSALNLAEQGICTICYNFMPVLDWTRTALRHQRPDGAECLRFDHVDLAVFDMFILRRDASQQAYSPAVQAEAARRFDSMAPEACQALTDTVLAGLPGAEESYQLDEFAAKVAGYAHMDAAKLRQNLANFLRRVLPVLVPKGIRLAIHPDDPPRPILGLPRVVSTAADIQAIFDMYDAPENGLTFCSGSLGVRQDNDLPAMLERFGPRVHFLHLRSTQRDAVSDLSTGLDGESFEEAAHLEGDCDMVTLVAAVMKLEEQRAQSLPFRPDHGHALQSDLRGPYKAGYPAVGRLRGMAEIRGVEHALRARGA